MRDEKSDDSAVPSDPARPDLELVARNSDLSLAASRPTAQAPKPAGVRRWLQPESRSRRILLAIVVYCTCFILFAVLAADRLREHTAANHFAHQAHAWIHGRNDVISGGPSYAGGNDFAEFEGKTYISFPPFPAMLMVPFVALAGEPEQFQDGQFIVWLAGIGPAVLFLVLEKLRRSKRSARTEGENLLFSWLFAFGTVYFFTSVQGTVWFAGHVVGVGVLSLYLLFALDAEKPVLAGLLLGFAFLTRPTMAPAALLFGLEALRVALPGGFALEGAAFGRIRDLVTRIDRGRFVRTMIAFCIPIVACLAFAGWLNHARYRTWSPSAFGHEHLQVYWQARITKWGLFGYHYLSKNLGCMLTILPWLPPKGSPSPVPFQVNEHGLALWFTTPLYFWLVRARGRSFLSASLLATAAIPMSMNLLYQNSGWSQFGYRFSNDYSLLLFVVLAITVKPTSHLFRLAAVWSIAWNVFGAATFNRPQYRAYYFSEPTQRVLFQDD